MGAVAIVACVPAAHQPFIGLHPSNVSIDMTGVFTFSPDQPVDGAPGGELQLVLARPCTTIIDDASNRVSSVELDCEQALLDQLTVIAHAPWHQELRGSWTDASHLVFRLDWKALTLDPLTDDAAAIAARPWRISGGQWTPTPAEAEEIVKRIGDATETETALVRGGAPPSLQITSFDVDGDTLRAGAPTTLTVRIVNRGQGAAYRVVGTLRSSIDALHDRRLSFGMIAPGGEKVRRLTVSLPPTETAPDTMVVLVVSEGNGAAPANLNHRLTIAPFAGGPKLAMHCGLVDHAGPHPDLDAGQRMVVRCTVDNVGTSAANVELEASVAGQPAEHAAAQAVAVSGHTTFELPLLIPGDLPLDTVTEIAIAASDHAAKKTVQTTITGTIRKSKLCTPGQLTREQYRAKLAELRAAFAAGDLTQAQLDHYDAELVTCLK